MIHKDTPSSHLVNKTIYLVDELRNAKIRAPHSNFTGIHNVSIRRDNRSSIFQHPPSRIEFQPILLGKSPKLHFACGIKQKAWPKLRHAILFEVFVKSLFGRLTGIFRYELAPGQDLHGWAEQGLDLARYSDQKIKLVFSTSVPKGENTEYCWSVWGDPHIEHQCPPLKKYPNRPTPAHVFLITADALRPDYLGVYGNTIVHTPNCDQLAQDGILFSHARVQTASTLGSHATMLLSQTPLTHTITTEWGSIPQDLLSLPEYLHSHGYHTVMIPSELELIDPKAGLVSLFSEHSPCYGNPVQDGSITTRVAMDWIDRQNKTTFFWLQYFDAHPPATPPEPYRSMYYSGDPADEANRYRAEAVSKIKGTEVFQEFSGAMLSLEQGRGMPDAFIIAKLDATAQAFHRSNFSDPDLALHLKNLGPIAYRNMPRDQFASWLDEQVQQLKNGNVSESLLGWLKGIMPMLQEINDDITIWLDGVVDFRYPLSQYSGAVSYFDSHLDRLFSYLKESNLYEQSLIILTSPHGEILDEHGIYFHHHTLTESCARIPMIIKPPKTEKQFKAGAKINGIFDTLDLFPTITDLLGLQPPTGIVGHGRASHIYDGSSIPEHDSFSINNSHTMASVTRGHYKFIKVAKDHMNSPEWHYHRGDKVLFDLHETPITDVTNLLNDLPDLAKEMEQRLDVWLKDAI